MLQFDEYKVKLNNLAPALKDLAQALDLEGAERELDMLQAESAADGFWDNLAKAQKVQQRIKNLQDKVDSQHRRQSQWDDLMALCEMGNEFEDESLIPECGSRHRFVFTSPTWRPPGWPPCSPGSTTAPT